MKKVEVRLLAELMNGSRKSDRELASARSWIPFNGLAVNNSSTSTAMPGLPSESPLAHIEEVVLRLTLICFFVFWLVR
jgi:hypothetical protein